MKIFFEKINRLILLVGCILIFILRGKANIARPNPSSIIIVSTGKLGDIVCCTPVFRAIRKHLPKTRIIAAGNIKLQKPILSDSGLVDDYINFEESGAIRRIKDCNADAAFITGPSFTPVALLYVSGIPLVVAPKVVGGFSPSETRPYKILRYFIKTFSYRMGEYAPRERLKALEPLGIFTDDTTKKLAYSSNAKKRIKELFSEQEITENDFIVGISPSAGNKIKEWPEERFAQVADYIIEKYKAKVVLIGDLNDEQKIQDVIKYIKNSTAIINTQGKFNLDELKAFISKLKLFISADTGPIYIAEAFNVPTIDIVGPIDEKEQPPIGDKNIVVAPKYRKSPELFVLNARYYDIIEARRQTESITFEMVTDAINKLYLFIRK